MKKQMSRILALILAVAMAVSLVAYAAPAEDTDTGAATSNTDVSAIGSDDADADTLYAGAGNGEIVFEEEMFASHPEGFSGGIIDNPYARVLLIQDEEMAAIVCLELVSTSEAIMQEIRDYIVEQTGMPEENIWIHTTHAITTPHAISSGDAGVLYENSVMTAVREAVDEAVASLQPAAMGISTGTCTANVNRNLELNGGWYIGWDDDPSNDLTSNETMTMVRFDDMDGNPIGMYMSYGIKPTAIDNSGQQENIREISPDVPGKACVLLEEEYGCPVMFCMPAAGDQIPEQETNNHYIDDEGNVQEEWLSIEFGIDVVNTLGAEMADVAESIVDDIDCDITSAPVSVDATSFEYETTGGREGAGTTDVPVSAIAVGDQLAFIGFQPELDAETELQLWDASPYAHTLLVSFMNGDSKYMPHAEAYDMNTVEAQKTGFAKGAAEELVSVATDMLDDIYYSGIQSVYGLGFVDADGSKLEAIAIKYGVELDAESVSLDDYEIQDYGTLTNPSCELGENPGEPLTAYVSETAEIGNPADSGRYVIVEVNTDYQLAAVCDPYAASMAAGAKQVGEVTTVDGEVIPAGEDFVVNYTENTSGRTTIYPAAEGTYFIYGIMDKYQLFYQEDGTAFHATNCFDEATGEYTDLDLPYALYVPEDYDESQEYMLVLQIEDAGFLGTDPMIALCESKAPANFASDEMQNYAKEQGYGGIIVVVPQIWEAIRTTRDNYTISSGVDATWQLMDSITDTYNVDMGRIYGTGQSMGGMQVIAMAAHRDNYFAGILEMGCQWGTNYDKDTPYGSRGVYSTYWNIFDTDDPNITFADAENWFYAVSDDNILVTNCTGDAFSTSVWGEFAYLYYDIAGVEIPYDTVYPLQDSIESMNATVDALVSQPNDTGIYWLSYTGGSHMLTWVYGHKLDASYYWLLSQTQDSENERGKLDLNKEFVKEDAVAASEYIAGNFVSINNGASRLLGTDSNGITYFYSVPAGGSGTAGYNSAWMNMNGGAPSAECGWIPDPAYTVDSIKITDDGLSVAFSGTEDGTYTAEVYATTVGIGAAQLVSSGAVEDGTYTDSSITGFDINVIYTVCLVQDGETVASAMHLDYDESIVNGFVQEDGQWRYYVNSEFQSDLNSVVTGTIDGTTGKWYVLDGVAQLDFTGLCDYAAEDGSWYYVTDGLVDTSCTSVVQNSYGWWYVKDGRVDFSCNSVEQNEYGWWYIVGGQVDFSYTGVAEYENEYGLWYIKNGQVDFSCNSVEQNSQGWWYVVGGQVQENYTGVANYANDYGWWYIKDGKVDFSCNSVEQNDYGWWYIVAGQVDFSYTGLANYANDYGWWYIKNGAVDFSKTGIEPNDYGWWRVVKGQVDFSCNSVEQNEYGWWYLVGGQVDFGYTGVANYANAYGWWYIKNGAVDFSCNSVEQNIYGWWYVIGGQVDFSYTGVANYANAYGWWYIKNGQVDFSFTGRASNHYGTWYCVNGQVDFSKS